MIALHLRAENDSNGNPRRCFLIMDSQSNVRAVLDEGYSGTGVVLQWAKKARRKVHMGPAVTVTPKEYRDWVRNAGHFA